MSEHGQPETAETVPASGLARFASSFEAGLRPAYTWIAYVGAAVLGLLVLAVVYSIIGRQFGAGLPGSQEIIEQSLVIIIFTVMGLEHMGHEKMTVDVIIKRFPDRLQSAIAPIIYLIAMAILAVAVWQLVVWGLRVQDRGQTTMGTLSLPLYPFTYLAAFGIFTLIPIYLVRFLAAVDRAVRK
jgi:TRAP-type C4-dicarboxylate transport system permease small subunit